MVAQNRSPGGVDLWAAGNRFPADGLPAHRPLCGDGPSHQLLPAQQLWCRHWGQPHPHAGPRHHVSVREWWEEITPEASSWRGGGEVKLESTDFYQKVYLFSFLLKGTVQRDRARHIFPSADLKGTVQWDVQLPVFFIIQTTLEHWPMGLNIIFIDFAEPFKL